MIALRPVRVPPEEIIEGTRWRLSVPGSTPLEVVVTGRNYLGPWWGGFGVELGLTGTLSYGVFGRLAEPVPTPA